MYFYGKKLDRNDESLNLGLVYVSQRFLSSIKPGIIEVFNNNVLPVFGGEIGDYSMYDLDDSSEEAQRISREEEFDLVWDVMSIVGITMEPQDIKPILRIFVTDEKYLIKADGIDFCELNFVLENDAGEVVPVTIDVMAPLKSPNGASKLIKCAFVDGVFSKGFKTLTSGSWQIPSVKPTTFKFVDEPVIIQSYDDGDIM